jgi:glycosyltransferase involved in cell wall biosynthesis
MKNRKIVFLHVGGHFVHREFARQITDNFVDINKEKIPVDYDIYFIEAGYPKIVLMKMFRLIKKNSKIISFFADPRLYFMKIDSYLDLKSQKIKRISCIKKAILKFLLKKVDGGICVSKFEQNLLQEFAPNIKSEVVYPFISDDRNKNLLKISPKLDSQKIIFIGNNDYYYKGLDVLINSFKILKKHKPRAELYILGNIPPKKEWQMEGIHFEGRVDILTYLKKCSLCVHPARGEAFGISVVESLLAGVPAMVSNETGAGEIVKLADENLLFKLNPPEISQKISAYFDSSLEYKENLSKKVKKEAAKFSRKKQSLKFKDAFEKLMKNIDEESQQK